MYCVVVVLALLVLQAEAFSGMRWSSLARTLSRESLGRRETSLNGVSREAEDEAQKMDVGKMVGDGKIPYGGVVGKENGALFDKPLQPFDPLKNTEDLPGVSNLSYL